MRTALEMYNAAYSNDVVGWPGLLFPMKWIAKKDFEVLSDQLLDNEDVLFSFMMLADTNVFGRNDQYSNYGGYSGYDQGPRSFGYHEIRHWTAFGLTNRSHLYYARWIPFSSDYGDMPISSGDLNIDINNAFLPLHSMMNISTLRKGFFDMIQKKRALSFIRTAIYETINSIDHHKDSEDGRRIYNQYVSSDDSDEGDEDNV